MRSLLILFTFSLILASCSCDTEVKGGHMHISCDAEKVDKGLFLSNGVYFKNAHTQSDEYARSGKHSVKLNKDQQYGFAYQFNNVKKGDVLAASVWRKAGSKNGVLAIGSLDSKQFQHSGNFTEVKDGWEKINCYFIAEMDLEKVNVYASNNSDEFVYFDDLEIDYYTGIKKPEPVENDDVLRITIPENAMDSIKMFRDIALEQEVITDDLKKYFDAFITVGGKNVPVKLRLKGDWTDHLETDKWSYRIKVRGNNSYQGIKKFSIQNPATRSYMMEWLAHKLFEKEDVLTTRYSFKIVVVNGVNMGVYAFEEHFDKRLLEHRKRREGPIVKFDESGLWQSYTYLKKTERSLYNNLPYVLSADILPFSSGRTKRTPSLREQFLVAQGQMKRYRELDPEVKEYFELDKLAKYLALYDVINSNHGMVWHNQRNYFNPISNKLEPVAYDCFMGLDLLSRREGILGMAPRFKSRKNMSLIDGLFQSKELEELYIHYLKKFTEEKYLKEFFAEIGDDIQKYEEMLGHEYPFYKLDKDFFINNCIIVKQDIKVYEKHSAENPFEITEKKPECDPMVPNVLLDKAALKVFTNYKDSFRVEMSMLNFHTADIEIVGYSTKLNKDVMIPLSKKIKLKAYTNKPSRATFKKSGKPKYFFYYASNCGDSLVRCKASSWPEPKVHSVLGSSYKTLPVKAGEGNEIILKTGSYNFTTNVVVPQGKRLIIEKGTVLKLSKSAGFISYSPVSMEGTSEEPILVESPDGTASGFTVLAPGDTSSFSHVKFKNMNTMKKNSWTLTGAVTVYEGIVDIKNCSFSDNNCEDGLNLVRCEFTMTNSTVENTFSDGFDADFCTGSVKACKFLNTGNDCIDFSGSKISIDNCLINGSGDKGISGGENSVLTVNNCKILKTSIAVASKDFSVVNVTNTTIGSSTYAFAAYRKKAEFGPATINAKSMSITGVKQKFLIELNSVVNLEGAKNIGKKEFDIDSMYMAFSK